MQKPARGKRRRIRATKHLIAACSAAMLFVVFYINIAVGGPASPDVSPTQSDLRPEAQGIRSLPLEPLAQMVIGSESVHSAIQDRLSTCMESKGFDYATVPYFGIPALDLGVRYGLFNSDRAVDTGYREIRPDSGFRSFEGGMNPAYLQLSGDAQAAWQHAFSGPQKPPALSDTGAGVSNGGCLDQAQSAIYGDRQSRAQLEGQIQSFMVESYQSAKTDPRVQAALDQWSSCMGSKGLSFTEPRDAMDAWARSETRSIPATDAQCNIQTGLAKVWNSVEIEVQSDLIANNRSVIDAWTAQLDREEEAAADASVS